jgi:hypothetical protein
VQQIVQQIVKKKKRVQLRNRISVCSLSVCVRVVWHAKR